jgi:hypothetical protein
MAKIEKGILGGLSGLVGTVVGATFRTIETLRSRPKKSKKAPVQEQIDQRSRFGLVTELISRINVFIEEGFKPKSKYLSPVNAAVQYHLNEAVTGVTPNFKVDFTKLLISNGKMPGVAKITFTALAEGNVKVTWSPDVSNFPPLERPLRIKDSARLLLYNENADSFTLTGYEMRSVGTIESMAPRPSAGDTVHGYLFFVAEDGKKTSRSDYMGSVKMLD